MSIFKGSATAIVTPFKDNKIDFDSLEKLVEWQISEGTAAIAAVGTTGEAPTLDIQEHLATIECVVQTAQKRVPVIGGCGSNDTRHAIMMIGEVERLGCDAALLVTPYYNKCSQRGLIQHYYAIADKTNLPMIVYSVPGRTGVNIEPKTVVELAKHKNIVGIKEASGNISQVVEICRVVPEDFAVYSGNDDMVVPLLSVGGQGVISVVSNVAPRDTQDMVMKYLAGDVEGAKKLQLSMKPLNDAMFANVNPIPVKYALSLMGKITGEIRLPLCEPDDRVKQLIEKELRNYGLI